MLPLAGSPSFHGGRSQVGLLHKADVRAQGLQDQLRVQHAHLHRHDADLARHEEIKVTAQLTRQRQRVQRPWTPRLSHSPKARHHRLYV